MLGAAAVVISDSLRLGMGWHETEGPRAGYFPFYIGLILGLSSAVNLVRAVFDAKGAQKTFTTRPALLQVLAVLVPLLLYVLAVALVGIYISSTVYMALFMWHFGKYPIWRGLIVGAVLSIAFFLMFEVWFLVPLPKNSLEEAAVPIVRGALSSLGAVLGL